MCEARGDERVVFGQTTYPSVASAVLLVSNSRSGVGASCTRRGTTMDTIRVAADASTATTSEVWLTVQHLGRQLLGIRTLTCADAAGVMHAFQHLSPASRRQRFLSTIGEYTSARREELTRADRGNRYALLAVLLDDTEHHIIGIGEYVRCVATPAVAEPAIAVVDAYQGRGVGTLLWNLLVEMGERQGVTHFSGTLQDSNRAAARLLARAGGRLSLETPGVLRFEVDVAPRDLV